MRSGLVAFGLGALGGAVIGGGVWFFASRQLDARLSEGSAELAADLGVGQEQLRAQLAAGREQLRTQVTQMVQAQVPDVIDARLAQYGITRQLIQNVERVLAYGQRAGVL